MAVRVFLLLSRPSLFILAASALMSLWMFAPLPVASSSCEDDFYWQDDNNRKGSESQAARFSGGRAPEEERGGLAPSSMQEYYRNTPLPNDILCEIFGYMAPSDLPLLSRVSRQFYQSAARVFKGIIDLRKAFRAIQRDLTHLSYCSPSYNSLAIYATKLKILRAKAASLDCLPESAKQDLARFIHTEIAIEDKLAPSPNAAFKRFPIRRADAGKPPSTLLKQWPKLALLRSLDKAGGADFERRLDALASRIYPEPGGDPFILIAGTESLAHYCKNTDEDRLMFLTEELSERSKERVDKALKGEEAQTSALRSQRILASLTKGCYQVGYYLERGAACNMYGSAIFP
jgi:hypothetical protein